MSTPRGPGTYVVEPSILRGRSRSAALRDYSDQAAMTRRHLYSRSVDMIASSRIGLILQLIIYNFIFNRIS